jgi:ERCC4-type nuclease
MILIDDRTGSKDLYDLMPPGSAEICRLNYGDVAFLGKGDGKPVAVGIELKGLNDVLQCIQSGRFSGHQLPGLLKDYDVVYLIVEGAWRPGKEGTLERLGRGGWQTLVLGTRVWMYRELDNWLASIESMTGVRLRRTESERETAAVILNLYHWWTDKEWEEHRSHLAFDRSSRPVLVKPSLTVRVAKELTGIGWEKAGAIARHFGSVRGMAMAEEKQWREIDGIGDVLSKRIVQELTGAA